MVHISEVLVVSLMTRDDSSPISRAWLWNAGTHFPGGNKTLSGGGHSAESDPTCRLDYTVSVLR